MIAVQVLLHFLGLSQDPHMVPCEANLQVQTRKQTRKKRAEVKPNKNKHAKKNMQEKQSNKEKKTKEDYTFFKLSQF